MDFLKEKGVESYGCMKLVERLTLGISELISLGANEIAEITGWNIEVALKVEGIIHDHHHELELTIVDCKHCGGCGYKYQSNE